MNFYQTEKLRAIDAKFEAQKIAFGPFVFQAALAMRDLGILEAFEKRGSDGATAEEIAAELNLSVYGVKVLAEAGLGMGVFLWNEEKRKFTATKVCFFLLNDGLTIANMDFVQDVNYEGFFHLKDAIVTGKPTGLKVFGEWPTVYEALAHLPEKAQKSWFGFDHYYSDAAFADVLPVVFKDKPKRLMDVGGNTGKWTTQCLQYDKDVHVTIADLPGQLRMAENNLTQKGLADRVSFHGVNLLNPNDKLPSGNQAIWMSQFLDCFSQEEIVSILTRASEVMSATDSLFILETYWDRQKYEASAFCLQQTSLYFTCLANGNSQMYHSEDMKKCLEKAGLKVVEETDNIGVSHTLFKCVKK
jgi:hypothetical protein